MTLSGRREPPDREDPVAAYLRELETDLRRRRSRRRIAREVRGHLEEGIEVLERERNLTRSAAAAETLDRFGGARQLAAQFNAISTRRSVAVRRLAVLWIAWLGAMGMGSATVWASLHGPAPARTSRHAATVAPLARPLCSTTDRHTPGHRAGFPTERCR